MDIKTADKLQALRKSHGYSQEALSEKLGVSRQAVSKWERGESSPDTDNLIALAGIYNVTLDDIINSDKELPGKDDLQNNTPAENAEQIAHEAADTTEKKTKPEDKSYPKRKRFGKALVKFPFVFLIVAVYVVLNLFIGKWHPSWLMLLSIPIYYHFAGACFAKTKKGFLFSLPVPEIIIVIYLILGLLYGLWAPGAISFIAIPIYYWAVAFYKNK